MDVWSENIFPAAFDGMLLDVLVTDDELNKALALHEMPRRDGALVQWMGSAPRQTRCTLIFFEREPDPDDPLFEDDHLTRFQFFANTAYAATDPREFVHPLFGSYSAYARNIRVHADARERDQLLVDVDFVEAAELPTLIDIDVTSPVEGGTAVMEVTNELAKAEAAELGVEYPLDQVVTTAQSWESDPELSVRKVNQDLGTASSRVAAFLDELAFGSSLENHVLFRLVTRLHAQLRKAADAFRFERAQVVSVELGGDTSLRAFVADRYGAAEADSRYEEILRLNDIGNPLLIPKGTTLRVHSTLRPGQARLQGFPPR